MIGWVVRVFVGLVVLVAVLAGAGYGYRAYRQSEWERAIAITTANGIDEGRYVKAGGLDQWITIRGQNRDLPVLLMVDGGPGAASSVFLPGLWEKEFVVVEWDQPGAGKTFGRDGSIDPNLSIEKMARDGTEIAEFLRNYLHKDKVFILASSWGTILGVNMIKTRPDLFYAYVGTGQNVSMERGEALDYEHVLAKARAKNDAVATKELETIGPPPYASEDEFRVQRKWASNYEVGGPSNSDITWSLLFAPRYSLADVSNWSRGFLASQDHFFGKDMKGPIMSVDFTNETTFDVPIFVFQGTEDNYTPFELAKAWADTITAPQKMFIAAEGAGHYAAFSHADEFRKMLLENIRPLAEKSPEAAPAAP